MGRVTRCLSRPAHCARKDVGLRAPLSRSESCAMPAPASRKQSPQGSQRYSLFAIREFWNSSRAFQREASFREWALPRQLISLSSESSISHKVSTRISSMFGLARRKVSNSILYCFSLLWTLRFADRHTFFFFKFPYKSLNLNRQNSC